jgi:hypothetical protein
MQARPNDFAEVMSRISLLPASEQVDAVLDYFVEVLAPMNPGTIRELRDQLMEHFSTCGGSFYTCEMMIAFIDAHLELRELERPLRSSL